jgi:hypothetical protein
MRTDLSAVEQIEFDAIVKAEYRSRGFLLREAVRRKENVVGSSVQFRLVGEVISVPTGFSQSVTGQDPGFTPKTADLIKYTTPVVVDTVEDLFVNFDTVMESAALIAQAMGRRSDQITINAVNAGAVTAGNIIAPGGTNLDYAKYTQIIEFFEDNGVPLGERWVAMSANNFRSMLRQQEFTSTFYTENRVLDKGMIRDYLGMNVVVIPTMTEGGLVKAGNIRNVLAWHKMSTGFAVGANFRTEVNYLPKETSWLANGIFSAGSVVIDPRGTLVVQADESV